MPNATTTGLPDGVGLPGGVGEGMSAIQSLAFQAASVARALDLDFTLKVYPNGTVAITFVKPRRDVAAAPAECGPEGLRRGMRGGRAHHANSRRAQTPAQPAVAHARGPPAPAASAAAGVGSAPKADAKSTRRKEKAKRRRQANAIARRAAGLQPRRSPSAIRSATARAVAHRHARKEARVGTLQRAEGAEGVNSAVAARVAEARAPRPAQSGPRLASEPVCGTSDDLDLSSDEGIDVCAMDLDSLPAAATPAAVVLPDSAKRRGVERQVGGPEPAARPHRVRQPRSRE
jgi:hypothetical protein